MNLKPSLLIALFLSVLVATSCKAPIPHKPFIIVNKGTPDAKGFSEFKYVDSVGNYAEFIEKQTKYSIGDTIK